MLFARAHVRTVVLQVASNTCALRSWNPCCIVPTISINMKAFNVLCDYHININCCNETHCDTTLNRLRTYAVVV